MALDTKYRPSGFGDVIGQAGTVRLLREFVRTGAGFRQSYLFAGPHGSGKTTLGRILARALLCDDPPGGDPCDSCDSCEGILRAGSSADFVEVDAATNSGKDNIRRITEQIQYSSFSGKRRIYLFDEAHQLSRDALDALLKPMEDTVLGTEEKRLVCIFCTTEPEKMRSTVVSRCAPTFLIRRASTEEIADRLAHVCDAEGIGYERDALELIAECSEAHIRDALKAVEGVSMTGTVTASAVSSYLRLDNTAVLLSLIEAIGSGDCAAAMGLARDLVETASPAVLYEKVSDAAILLYSGGLGAAAWPSWWDGHRASGISRDLGPRAVRLAARFAARPGRVSPSVFLCDVAASAREAILPETPDPVLATVEDNLPKTGKTARQAPRVGGGGDGRIYNTVEFQSSPSVVGGSYLDPRGVNWAGIEDAANKRTNKQSGTGSLPSPAALVRPSDAIQPHLEPGQFARIVLSRLGELRGSDAGSTRPEDMGDPRTHQDG
jgi:DNA polymerase III subunit gamma/tau